jgi:hypothetical protein
MVTAADRDAAQPIALRYSEHVDRHSDGVFCIACGLTDEIAAALAAVRAEPAPGYLITCPWCGLSIEDRILQAQMSHLIECGDRKEARVTALEAALATHQCPFGPGVVYCGTHKVYHSESIDQALATGADGLA